jgi:hypothetical protein
MPSDLPGLNTCPACRQELRGHRYARLASRIDNSKDQTQLLKFLEDIQNRIWSNVLGFRDWQGDSDVTQLYCIKCPFDGFGLVVIRSPVELSEDDRIISIDCLTAGETEILASLTTDRNWKPLP